MNPFGQLLWREWRRSRTILTIALATLVVMVFLSILFIAIVTPESLAGRMFASATLLFAIGSVVLPIIAAARLGGERDERAAESVAPRLPSRIVGPTAQLLLLSAISVATSALVLWIIYVREFSQQRGIVGSPTPLDLPIMIGVVTILATAIIWKCREWIASPPIAAVLAIVLPSAALWSIAVAAVPSMATGHDIERLLAAVANWGEAAATLAFAIGTFLLPFLAANVLAGERADRSAEFITPLPVSRVLRLTVKVTFLAAVAVTAWVPWLSINYVREHSRPSPRIVGPLDDFRGLVVIVALSLLATAIAWLIAAWIESPVIAGMTAIAMPIVIPWACFELPRIVGIQPFFEPNAFIGLWFTSGGMPQPFTFLVALALFGAGSVRYLRRLE